MNRSTFEAISQAIRAGQTVDPVQFEEWSALLVQVMALAKSGESAIDYATIFDREPEGVS